MFRKWKRVAPSLYDWLANNHLVWPALACRYASRWSGTSMDVIIFYILISRCWLQVWAGGIRRTCQVQADNIHLRAGAMPRSASNWELCDAELTADRPGLLWTFQDCHFCMQTAKEDKTPNKLVIHSVSIPEVWPCQFLDSDTDPKNKHPLLERFLYSSMNTTIQCPIWIQVSQWRPCAHRSRVPHFRDVSLCCIIQREHAVLKESTRFASFGSGPSRSWMFLSCWCTLNVETQSLKRVQSSFAA